VKRRVLALGDSYTIGEGIDASERWPMRLAAALRGEGLSVADPRIIARTGWTTDELLAAIDGATPPIAHDFDLVTLLIGVNDQYRGLGVGSFQSGFEALLRRAIEFGAMEPRRVLVVSIPDWSVTPFAAQDPRNRTAIAAEIDQFNAVAREKAGQAGTAFVDVTVDSRRAAHDSTLLAADKLHPSAKMYASWVQLILPHARGI
jgi:lysophospholipase L1-like esterase